MHRKLSKQRRVDARSYVDIVGTVYGKYWHAHVPEDLRGVECRRRRIPSRRTLATRARYVSHPLGARGAHHLGLQVAPGLVPAITSKYTCR
jgi:hypothetical protein